MAFPHSDRLNFRVTDDDLDHIALMLADPQVMEFYPRAKTRDEARGWINWNKDNYAELGYGLWLTETKTGEFVGDCGLTWQAVNDRTELEVGCHVRTQMQGQGYATEAAAA